MGFRRTDVGVNSCCGGSAQVARSNVGKSARSAGDGSPGCDAHIEPVSKPGYDQCAATRFCGYPLWDATLPATVSVVVPAIQSGSAGPTLAGGAPSSNHAADWAIATTCCCAGTPFRSETGACA